VGKSRLPIPAILLALALSVGVTACGGGESDEDKIASMIENAATTTDPATCKEDQTTAFVEQSQGLEGKKGLEECEKSTEEGKGNPDSVDVSEVEAEGDEGTAAVAFHGGSYDGQTLVVNVVEEGGNWKLNEVEEFKVFDAEKLLAALTVRFEEEADAGNIPAELGECIVEGLEEFSEPELEEVAIESREALEGLAEECAG
jgi:hypothetical protein